MLAPRLSGGIYDQRTRTSNTIDRARALTRKLDVEIMIQDGEIVIVDGFWRSCPDAGGAMVSSGGRSQGKVKIERENQTLATVTFRTIAVEACRHDRHGGLEAQSRQIYSLDVVIIPPTGR